MITVTTFKWYDRNGRYNNDFLYTADHVNRLKSMVARNLSLPHRFVCITDDPAGLDKDIIPIPIDMGLLRTAGHRYPKLMIFRPDAGNWLGERILMLDLDTVIVAPIDRLVDRDDEFVVWQDAAWGVTSGASRYNTSIVLLKAGSRPQVWTDFDLKREREIAAQRGFNSTDQGWVFRCLGENEPVWTREDGVLSFRAHVGRRGLPRHARIVMFHGRIDPSQAAVQARHPWVARHWF